MIWTHEDGGPRRLQRVPGRLGADRDGAALEICSLAGVSRIQAL